MSIALAVLAAAVVAAALLAAFVLSRIKTPKPGQILVVTGGANGPVAHTRRAFVLPFVRRAEYLSVGVQSTQISLPEAMTGQGVSLAIQAVVAFKIDTDQALVGNAIERFAERPERMEHFVHNVFAGHLRAIVGAMSAEDVTTGRDALATQVRSASSQEMASLGLKIDTVQISDVEDAQGSEYLASWRQKEQSKMRSSARVAEAQAVQEARIREADAQQAATEREAQAAAAMAEAQAAAAVRESKVRAEADQAKATAAQAGPLADAVAQQEVIRAETAAEELRASLTEKRLTIEVTRPAEAQRDAVVAQAEGEKQSAILHAEGQRQQTVLAAEANAQQVTLLGAANAQAVTLEGEAEGAAIRAKGLAEAAGIEARGKAFAENADAVIKQQIAESLPDMVRAAAEPIASVGTLQVLDIATLQNMPGGSIATVAGLLPTVMDMIGDFAKPTNGAPVGAAKKG